jgi:predicted protein tyrosine phosphatase
MRVLFVCTANISRSRTAEEVFSVLAWTVRDRDRQRHEVRSAGTHPDPGGRALTRSDLQWADVICVMEPAHAEFIQSRWPLHGSKIRLLDIPDLYQPGDPTLRDLLTRHILVLLGGRGQASPPGSNPDPSPAPSPSRPRGI